MMSRLGSNIRRNFDWLRSQNCLRKAPKICRDMKLKTILAIVQHNFFSNSHCRRPSVTLAKHHWVLFASLVVSLVRTHMSSSTDKQNSHGNFDRAVDKSTLSSTGTRVLLNVNVNRQYKSKYSCTETTQFQCRESWCSWLFNGSFWMFLHQCAEPNPYLKKTIWRKIFRELLYFNCVKLLS